MAKSSRPRRVHKEFDEFVEEYRTEYARKYGKLLSGVDVTREMVRELRESGVVKKSRESDFF